MTVENSEDGWTKVEKRKSKKTKKVEGKANVCVSSALGVCAGVTYGCRIFRQIRPDSCITKVKS